MFRTSSDHPVLKFLDSKDVSPTAPSFRIYYGGVSGSVPFVWESQPGTPKHTTTLSRDSVANSLPPPLTPPPSYYYQPSSDSNKKPLRSLTRYRFLRNLWYKINFVSRAASPTVDYSPSVSSSSSSSSAGSYSSAPNAGSSPERRRGINWASFDQQDGSRSSNEDGEIIDSGLNISRNQACFRFSKSGNNAPPCRR